MIGAAAAISAASPPSTPSATPPWAGSSTSSRTAVAAGVDPVPAARGARLDGPPGDLRRLAALGVTACIQPAFLPADSPWLEARLGPGPPAPRLQLPHAGRRRRPPGRAVRTARWSRPTPCGAWPPPATAPASVPEEALTAAEALALFTTGAARAIGEDARLEPGAPATLTVLDGDPVAAGPAELRRMATIRRCSSPGGRSTPPPGIGGLEGLTAQPRPQPARGAAPALAGPAGGAVVGVVVLHRGALHTAPAAGAPAGQEGLGGGEIGAVTTEELGHQDPGRGVRVHRPALPGPSSRHRPARPCLLVTSRQGPPSAAAEAPSLRGRPPGRGRRNHSPTAAAPARPAILRPSPEGGTRETRQDSAPSAPPAPSSSSAPGS